MLAMLLLFNKTIKPLNQFTKKIQKKFFIIFDKIFSQIFFLLHTGFYESWLYAKYQKKEQPFGIYSKAIDRNGSSIYREKLII